MQVTVASDRSGLPVRSTSTPIEPCQSHVMLARIGEKWTYLTLMVLASAGEDWVRSAELKRCIFGISQRMLTVTLRHLERDGLVLRQIHAEIPPRVEYRLSDLAQSMLPALATFAGWIGDHWDEIQRAQSAYDSTRT